MGVQAEVSLIHVEKRIVSVSIRQGFQQTNIELSSDLKESCENIFQADIRFHPEEWKFGDPHFPWKTMFKIRGEPLSEATTFAGQPIAATVSFVQWAQELQSGCL